MNTPDNLVTFSQYARERKVTPSAIHKAIKSGRLKDSVVDFRGHSYIDRELANIEWKRYTDPGLQYGNQGAYKNGSEVEGGQRETTPQYLDFGTPPSLATSKEKEAYHKAIMAEFEQFQLASKLMIREEVEKMAEEQALRVKKVVENIPVKIVAKLAHLLNVDGKIEAESILEGIMRDALREMV